MRYWMPDQVRHDIMKLMGMDGLSIDTTVRQEPGDAFRCQRKRL